MKFSAGVRSLFVWVLPVLGLSLTTCAQNDPDQREWRTLFNGSDTKDWMVKIHHHDVGVNFGNTFRVEDGLLKVRYDQYGDFNNQFGHLYYKEPFTYYHLMLEYHFTGEVQRGSPDYVVRNSGVMFHSQDPRSMPKEQDWPISVEMQFLASLDNGKPRPTGNMCSPGTIVVYQGKSDPRHCIESGSKTYAMDEWISAELIVLGDSLVTHMINGETVLQYSKPRMAAGVVNNFDPAIWQPGKLLNEGYIALQSEGQPIDFRNIKLLPLRGCMDKKASNYKRYYVKSDPGSCKYK